MDQIKASIVGHSVSPMGKNIITYELEYPRFIHSELMTHRLFSRNAASSRAIPIAKMIESVRRDPASPVEWGKNQSGMQAKELFTGHRISTARYAWESAAMSAVESAELLNNTGLHKQIVNRVLEPFQIMKTIVTSTEFDNWFWLRNHEDAQPEIRVLANKMLEAAKESTGNHLNYSEWHLPYIKTVRGSSGVLEYYTSYGLGISLEDALKVSASCCAQVSYRVLDSDLDKAKGIYDKLVGMVPVHASPFEHQATPMPEIEFVNSTWPDGVTHMDADREFWSGNFKGWIQNRQLIPNNACWDYKED